MCKLLLASVGLHEYIPLIEDLEFDGETMMLLDDDSLRLDLGVKRGNHRAALLKAIAARKAHDGDAGFPPTHPPTGPTNHTYTQTDTERHTCTHSNTPPQAQWTPAAIETEVLRVRPPQDCGAIGRVGGGDGGFVRQGLRRRLGLSCVPHLSAVRHVVQFLRKFPTTGWHVRGICADVRRGV